jgi:hypothetical protein
MPLMITPDTMWLFIREEGVEPSTALCPGSLTIFLKSSISLQNPIL